MECELCEMPRRASDTQWVAMLQKLFALLEPDVPSSLRGVLNKMKDVAERGGIARASIDELIRSCEGMAQKQGVADVDAHFIRAYTSENPAVYKLASKHFNDVENRLRIARACEDDFTKDTVSQFFSADLLACAGFYIRVQQALHRLPPRYFKRGCTSYRGVAYSYGSDLQHFEKRVVCMFTPKSTSIDRSVALGFAQGGTLFQLENNRGWDISEFSIFPGEEEVVVGMFNEYEAKVTPADASADGVDEILLVGRDPLTLCALGVTGGGKTTTLNALGRSDIFDNTREGLQSSIQELRAETLPWLGCGATVRFVDASGLGDTHDRDLHILQSIQNEITENIKYVDGFLLVVKYEPVFHNHVKEMLGSYRQKFGQEFCNHLIVVVTHWDYNEQYAKRTRKAHQGIEGAGKYQNEVNVILQEILQVEKKFDFVFMDNECDMDNPEDAKELHTQLSKLWRCMADKKERFNGHKQESLIESVVDTSNFKCSCPRCPNPLRPAFWQTCVQRKCDHFGKMYHYDCWRRVHKGLSCVGKVYCESIYMKEHADKVDQLESLLQAGLLAGAAPTTELMADIVCHESIGEVAVDVAEECLGGDCAVTGVEKMTGLLESIIESLTGEGGDGAHGVIHAVIEHVGVVAHVVGPLVGALIAWKMYEHKRAKACRELAMHYEDPSTGLSPEQFAIQALGAYRGMQFKIAAVAGCACVTAAVTAATGFGLGAIVGAAFVSFFFKFGARWLGQNYGEKNAKRKLEESHWQIVAQCLCTLELVSYVRDKLQNNVADLTWEAIRSYYRQLVRKEHPDKVVREDFEDDDDLRQKVIEATSKFVQIQTAYEILDGYRKHYSESLNKWIDLLEGAYSLIQGGWMPPTGVDVKEFLEGREQRVFKDLPGGVAEEISKQMQKALSDRSNGDKDQKVLL